jgi:hypothetical protein
MSPQDNGRVSQLQSLFARLEARLEGIEARLSELADTQRRTLADHETRLRTLEAFRAGFTAWVALVSLFSGALGALVTFLLEGVLRR